MPSQMKISNLLNNYSYNYYNCNPDNIKYILDLERHYFKILWEIFYSDEFIDELLFIENDIQNNYELLNRHWDLKNKIKIPAERLVRKHIYSRLSDIILKIFPSAISGDIGFITENAVINIDIKTLDIKGNKGDISYLQFENNQSNFKNKNLDCSDEYPKSGIHVETVLPIIYKDLNNIDKPVLTYFIVIVYSDDNKSFTISRDTTYPTIQLKCLPNGILSPLFNFDIVQNFKTYDYFQEKDGYSPIYLTSDPDMIEREIYRIAQDNPNKYKIIKGRTKLGLYSQDELHTYYNSYGVSYFPVRRQKKTEIEAKYFLEAVKSGHTSRVSNDTLLDRYDSNDNHWYGVIKHTII